MVDRARAHHRAGRLQDALHAWRSAIALSPSDPVLDYNVAALLGDLGAYEQAIAALRQARGKGLKAPEAFLVEGRALLGLLRTDEAASAYRRYLRERPADIDALREYAQMIWMRSGDRKAALQPVDAAIGKVPDAPALHALRAQIVGQTGDPQAEYQMLCDALARFGAHPLLEHAACKAALECDEPGRAVRHGETLEKTAPDFEKGRSAHCTALIANGDLDRAQARLDALRAAAPQNQYYIALQGTLWRLKDDARHRTLFDYDAFVFRAPLEAPEGWRSTDAYLDDLSASLDARHGFRQHPFFLSVRGGSQVALLTQADSPAMRAYPQAVSPAVQAFAAHLGAGDDPLRCRNTGAAAMAGAWSILLPPRGFHVNHVHPEGWISSACHLRHDGEADARDHAGWLKFGEPGIKTPVPLEPEHFVKPEPGVAVFFPSYLWHGTVPFDCGAARLTVAADFAPAAPPAPAGR